MGRPALTDEQRAAMRGRIRDAAIELYREGGLAAITIRGVAASANLSPSILYSYYPNRQALMQSLWYEPVVGAVREIISVAAATRDPVKRLERVLTTYIGFAEKNPEIYQGAFMFVRPGSMAKPPVQDLEALDSHRILRDAIVEGQKEGKLRKGNASEMAQCLWAAVHGALALPVNIEMFAFNPPVELARATLRQMIQGLLKP